MKQLQRRVIQTAERLQGQPVCHACSWWGASTWCDEQGTCLRRKVCPACGRRVLIRRRWRIVGVDFGLV